MKKELKETVFPKNYLPMNIQLFAEDGGNENEGGEDKGNETPKTYSQEEYNKLLADIEKLKGANNKLSSENAEHKRKAKEKLSEDEKKELAQKEKDEALANAQKELLSIKLSKEFIVCGFDEETANELIDTFNNKDAVEFAKALSQKIKTLVDNARKEEQEAFKKNGTLPPNGRQQQGVDPIVERYIKSKTTNSNNKAREQYLK